MGETSPAGVCVIVVNWNGWNDTVQCLESLLRIQHAPIHVVVCDNGSRDDSIRKLVAWAAGELIPPMPSADSLRMLITPNISKPIDLIVRRVDDKEGNLRESTARVIVLDIGRNLGFAGANNIGMQYARERFASEYFWLLNNDTLVTPGALESMLLRMHGDSRAGICGSTIARMQVPDSLQARGGASYNRWLGIPRHVGEGERTDTMVDGKGTEESLDYIVGASMLISAEFVKVVGLLSEDYFLYFEELDWALRARGRFRLVYAPASIIYHKEGASTGGKLPQKQRPITTDYYWIRNRLLITIRYYPYALPMVVFACFVTLARRALRVGPGRAVRLLIMLLKYGWRAGKAPLGATVGATNR